MKWEPKNQNFREAIAAKLSSQPFMQQMGFKLDKLEPGRVKGSMQLEHLHTQHNGWVHGGVSAILSDIVAGFAAFSLVEEGAHVVTVELKVSYLNPGIGSLLQAEGIVLKAGSRLHFCESEIWVGEPGQLSLVAKASATMAILPKDFNDAKHRVDTMTA